MSRHYETLDLVDYSRGVWSADEASELFAHCQRCDDCGARLAAVLALRESPAVRQPAAVRAKPVAAVSAVVAAGIAVFAAIGYFSAPATGEGVAPQPVAEAPADPVIEDPVARELAGLATKDAPGDRYLRIIFGRLPVVSTNAADAGLGSPDSEDRFRNAAEALWRGQVAAALPELELAYHLAPEDRLRSVLLGIGRYLSGERNGEVEALLRRGLEGEDDGLWERSAWYLANHFLRNGDLPRTREILEVLEPRGTLIASKAASLLRTISETEPEPAR